MSNCNFIFFVFKSSTNFSSDRIEPLFGGLSTIIFLDSKSNRDINFWVKLKIYNGIPEYWNNKNKVVKIVFNAAKEAIIIPP